MGTTSIVQIFLKIVVFFVEVQHYVFGGTPLSVRSGTGSARMVGYLYKYR